MEINIVRYCVVKILKIVLKPRLIAMIGASPLLQNPKRFEITVELI